MEEYLARKYTLNQRKSLSVLFYFTVLVNSVSRLVQTVQNATIKTTVKKLLFYSRTTERNSELYFVSYYYS